MTKLILPSKYEICLERRDHHRFEVKKQNGCLAIESRHDNMDDLNSLLNKCLNTKVAGDPDEQDWTDA